MASDITRPAIWKSGMAVKPTCSPMGVSSQRVICTICETMLRCVSSAPLGRPVVPPVYCMAQVSSGLTLTSILSAGSFFITSVNCQISLPSMGSTLPVGTFLESLASVLMGCGNIVQYAGEDDQL